MSLFFIDGSTYDSTASTLKLSGYVNINKVGILMKLNKVVTLECDVD